MSGISPNLVIYAAVVAGAAALVLLMPKPGPNLRPLGALLGAGTLGAMWFGLCPLLRGDQPGLDHPSLLFYYVFSFIGIASAVRVITHTRPVYAALWFVMVILSSAGLFLVLSAEFMAMALVIIYGGAILVTYMFVIMLATQPSASDRPEDQPEFERYAREPFWATVAGFLLLAVLLSFVFDPNLTVGPDPDNPLAHPPSAASNEEVSALLSERNVTEQYIDGEVVTELTPIGNSERVGLDLFQAHPLAIELAGLILLLSLIGAVVIARTQVPGSLDTYEAAADPNEIMEASA